MSIEAMKQALEALESINEISKPPMNIPLAAEIDGAMDALRQAIEQAEQWDTSDMAYRPNGLSVEQEPYADKANQLNSDRIQIDPVTGNVSIGAPPKRPVKSFSGGVPWYATDAPKHEDDDIQEYKKPWVGLTDLEVGIYNHQFNCTRLVRDIEALLKERNT
jgi:hypothetical protein